MTNNNLEEKFESLIKNIYSEELFGSVDENLIPKDGLMAATMRAMAKSIGHIVATVFRELLTKKDQEHKAELEMINGEVQKLLETLPELESDEYDAGLLDMKQLVLAILDSHINKQNI